MMLTNIKEKVMAQSEFWNKLKNRIKEVSIAAADFTEEQAVIGKLKFEILTLKRKSDQVTKQLGSHIYNMSDLTDKPSVFDDYEVKEFIREIDDIKAQVEVKRSEIDVVADNFRTKKGDESSAFHRQSVEVAEVIEDPSPPKPKRGRPKNKAAESADETSKVEEKPQKRRKYTRKETKAKPEQESTNDNPESKVKGK